jgi:hypothetical protein
MRKLAALVAAMAALGIAPRHANAQQLVTCESFRGNRQFCEVNTAGGVSVNRQLSSTSCIRGQTWGYTRNAIWVRNGCRAEFVVNPTGQYGSGRYNRYGRNGRVYKDHQYGYGNTVDAGNAQEMCRQTVRNLLKRNVAVETWMMNSSDQNTRVGWRVDNGPPGECRIDRNGRITLR